MYIVVKGKHKDPNPLHRIHYETVGGNDYSETLPSKGDPTGRPQVVDRAGRPLKLSAYQKNSLYRQAKNLKRHISEGHCTKRECWDTDEHSVRKMKYEMSKLECHRRRTYHKAMTAIGANPHDCSVERLRRRGRHNQ